MTTQTATRETTAATNGVDVGRILAIIESIENDEKCADMQFRLSNRWLGGGVNRSQMQEFRACGEEDRTRTELFTVTADEPMFIGGDDGAPTPVEFLLHALISSLTTTAVYHAAVRGIAIEAAGSELSGDLDLRGLSESVRKGYHRIGVTMRFKTSSSAEEIRELAMFSAVYETVSKSVPVDLVIETY